ncbi:hypothetical protein CR205_12900 [Alteribacter lacisalsi]|uniref:DUF4352 domain-containing protein n=1 Tax=Alteribacter lacisalsi TaxID=2045244 RepID=A0A2W0HI04_9BACI|nr:hypothetical protein [Alteribacter lacisalsi]PYZ96602.1 hypothetical protein CR205_12900 [Alteribacter lacisalsi]
MKKSVLTAALSTTLVIAACGDAEDTGVTTEGNGADVLEDGQETDDTEEESPEDQDDSETSEPDHDEEDADDLIEDEWGTEVGETIENEGGSFTLVNRLDGIEPMESGPIVMNVEQINVISAQYEGELAESMATNEADYIQVDMAVENTADADHIFNAAQGTLVTNTGEQLEADLWMSDPIPGDIMSGATLSGSAFYVLESSAAEDIEWVRIQWSAPQDEDWEDVGEEIDEQFELD